MQISEDRVKETFFQLEKTATENERVYKKANYIAIFFSLLVFMLMLLRTI